MHFFTPVPPFLPDSSFVPAENHGFLVFLGKNKTNDVSRVLFRKPPGRPRDNLGKPPRERAMPSPKERPRQTVFPPQTFTVRSRNRDFGGLSLIPFRRITPSPATKTAKIQNGFSRRSQRRQKPPSSCTALHKTPFDRWFLNGKAPSSCTVSTKPARNQSGKIRSHCQNLSAANFISSASLPTSSKISIFLSIRPSFPASGKNLTARFGSSKGQNPLFGPSFARIPPGDGFPVQKGALPGPSPERHPESRTSAKGMGKLPGPSPERNPRAAIAIVCVNFSRYRVQPPVKKVLQKLEKIMDGGVQNEGA